jgi:hypothetical protein
VIRHDHWPENLKIEHGNGSGPSFEINKPKANTLLQRILPKVNLTFFNTKRREYNKSASTAVAKPNKQLLPEDFVKEENERINDIKKLIDAKYYNAALKSLMADTDGDLHYFNKVKREAENTKHDASFDRRHGKLKCSVASKVAPERECLWHGQTDRGFPLRCHNKCINHSHETTTDHLGVSCPRPLDFCAYHVKYCVETINHSDLPVRIRVPNEHALCNECFILKTMQQPPILQRVPGTRRKRK